MLPVKHGSPTVAMPGYQVEIVDETNKTLPPNKMGSIVVKLPLPPSCLPTLWLQDERFKESYLAEFPGYYKTADAGFKDELEVEVPCGFIVLKAGVDRPPDAIEREIVALLRERIGPVAAFKLAITVVRLPKTRSGKILRGTMKKIADGDPWNLPATIDDPAVLDEIGVALKGHGLAAG